MLPEEAIRRLYIFESRKLASIMSPFLEKYGEEAKEIMAKAMYDLAARATKELIDEVKPEERSLKTRNDIYSRLFEPYTLAGQKVERSMVGDKKYVAHVLRCVALEGFMQVTKDQKILCDLCEVLSYWFDRGVAETINPKLTYTKYEFGLARGESYCNIILELKE